MATFKTWIELPRWARGQRFLLDTAYDFQLPINLQVDKGWFTERIYFTVDGPADMVERFKRKVHRAILHYNKD
jgi:hypothetical protein